MFYRPWLVTPSLIRLLTVMALTTSPVYSRKNSRFNAMCCYEVGFILSKLKNQKSTSLYPNNTIDKIRFTIMSHARL